LLTPACSDSAPPVPVIGISIVTLSPSLPPLAVACTPLFKTIDPVPAKVRLAPGGPRFPSKNPPAFMALFTSTVMAAVDDPALKQAASAEFHTTGVPVRAEVVDHSAVTVSQV